MTRQQLPIALRAALLSRDVRQIRILLATYGLPAFSGAVAGYSPRTAADTLSLLSPGDRKAVLCHLPRTLCEKLRPLGIALHPAKPVRHLS
jgi:hypothetical protein